MGTLARGGVFVFEGFRLDRNTGALYRQHEDGSLLPIAAARARLTFSACWSNRQETSSRGTS